MKATGICPFCGKAVDKFIMFRGDVVGCQYCGINIKQTNADRIRAMTDEELAFWLDDVCKSSYDEGYTKETKEPLMSDYPSIASEWAKWLKEDA